MTIHKYRVKDARGNCVQVNAPSALKAKKFYLRMFRGMAKVVSVEQLEEVTLPEEQAKKRPVTPVVNTPQPKPNEPCPCGSGKKYKRCCRKDGK